jgi:GDP-L-fucose synthase
MDKKAKIYLAGHTGLVGSAILRSLKAAGFTNLIIRDISELDLRDQTAVNAFFSKERPEFVFLAAAKVGGILANSTYQADFIYDNLLISANVIHAAYLNGTKKLLNLGSSCIYPKNAPQPMKEEYFLSGSLEPTNEPYAIAKIAAIKLCRYYNKQYGTNFISVMPTNQFGYNDNYNLETAHVLPAMIRKIHEAKEAKAGTLYLWGSGEPYREFMFADDLADACLFLMEKFDAEDVGEFINIGSGQEVKIKKLAELIRRIVGFSGTIQWDLTKPDGMSKKLLDTSKMKKLGWEPSVNLEEGIKQAYSWYLANMNRRQEDK